MLGLEFEPSSLHEPGGPTVKGRRDEQEHTVRLEDPSQAREILEWIPHVLDRVHTNTNIEVGRRQVGLRQRRTLHRLSAQTVISDLRRVRGNVNAPDFVSSRCRLDEKVTLAAPDVQNSSVRSSAIRSNRLQVDARRLAPEVRELALRAGVIGLQEISARIDIRQHVVGGLRIQEHQSARLAFIDRVP